MANFVVSNLADSGAGSLRAAIQGANAEAVGVASTITFSIAGTISLATALPSIGRPLTIDATTAPGHVAGGAPVVGLNCNAQAGLVFAVGSDSSQLLGVAVGNASGHGVTLHASTITLSGNYIGLNTAGTAQGNGGDGVFIGGTSAGNIIGTNPGEEVGVVSNVISGNAGNGISLNASSGNTLVNNFIGTNATGTAAIGNGAQGIWVTAGASNNVIGGTAFTDPSTGDQNDPTGNKGTVTPVFVVPPLGNLVSGNAGNGILIDALSQSNVLNGNFIGTTADGNGALGNTLDGVRIDNADNNSLIGCNAVQNPFVYYNVVSGNGGNGLQILNSDGTTVHANFFGIGADNATLVGNTLNGILVGGDSAGTTVGGVIPLGNVSAGNGANGIAVVDTASAFTTFNTFGGLFAFGGAAPNGENGLLITATGGSQVVETNVFSGNTGSGIVIAGDASGITIDPNIVGLTTDGQAPLANGSSGLLIGGTAHNVTVGGYQNSIIPRNIFSGNTGFGIALIDGAHDITIYNTYVGTDVFGLIDFGNAGGGILVAGTVTNTIIGGPLNPDPDQPVFTLVSGNGGNGITLTDETSNTQILNNIIGYAKNGTTPMPNDGAQVATGTSTGNTIGGNTIACFLAGTMIATETGEVAVERLAAGMRVRTADGGTLDVVWVGQRRIDCTRHPNPHLVWPVRVVQGAFGPGQPVRDLFLSPDHAVALDGVLIPVRHLVNGRTVLREARDSVHYYHVELARHGVLLAEGLPCESFLDTGNRGDFANGGTVITLHPRPAMQVWREDACAPLAQDGAHVEAARSLLLARAAELGHATTRDPGVRLVVDGAILLPEIAGRRHSFDIPAGARRIRLVSRSVVPAEAHADGTDPRRLGIALCGLTLGGMRVSLADRRLGGGWHPVEGAPNLAPWRWTEGSAALVVSGGQALTVDVLMGERYWLEDSIGTEVAERRALRARP